MRFSRDVAATFATRVLMVGLGVASSVLTARALGPGGRGILATLGALSGIGLQLGNLGLHASNTYQVSRDRSLLAPLWGNSRRTSWALGISLALVTVALAWAVPPVLGEIRFSLLLVSAACIPFQLLFLLGLNLVVGLGRIPLFNLLEVTFRGIGVAALFVVLVLLGGDIRWVLVLNLLIAALGALAVARVLRGLVRASGEGGSRTDMALFRSSVGYGARAYTASLLAYLIVRSDMLLVNTLKGTADAGIYSIAVQVADVIYLLPVSIGIVLFPISRLNTGRFHHRVDEKDRCQSDPRLYREVQIDEDGQGERRDQNDPVGPGRFHDLFDMFDLRHVPCDDDQYCGQR